MAIGLPKIRTKRVLFLLRVLFFLYLAIALITVVIGYYDRPRTERWSGFISFVLMMYVGFPTSVPLLDMGVSRGLSDERLRFLLFVPIALNSLVLWSLAFVTSKPHLPSKRHLHLTLVAVEIGALLGLLDARMAFACARDYTSILPATFWQELLGWMTTGGDAELLECPNISWAIVTAVALIVAGHGYYALAQRRKTLAPSRVDSD